MSIEIAVLDRLQSEYKAAVDAWVEAIRKEEALATEEHSVADLDAWEQAGYVEEDLRKAVKKAKEHYEDALRKEFFDF